MAAESFQPDRDRPGPGESPPAGHSTGPRRPQYRPPVGLPLERPGYWAGPLSFLFHALLVLLIVAPALVATVAPELVQGAGGPGPAGGGGGGRRGSGGGQNVVERLQYFQPPPPAPAPQVTPPEVTPPEVTPPKEEPKPTVTPVIDIKIDAPKSTADMSLTAGVGGGTGNDGSAGTGPGSGGGVGSGVGTGRGSGTGPGTGGGPGTIYPPTPDFLTMPPFPIPQKARGQVVVLSFTVDERGNVLKLEFTPTRDGGYNRRIRDQFSEVRFRPAVRWDGTPVAAIAQVTLNLF